MKISLSSGRRTSPRILRFACRAAGVSTCRTSVLMLLTLTLVLATIPSLSQPPRLNEKLKSLEPAITKVLKDWNVPGCGVGIVIKDKLVYSRGFGYRDLEKRLPVTPNTLFQIASNTKLFTATAVGFLVNEGKLDWDTPVKKYVPQIQFFNDELTNSVTIRDMLSHRTGISRHDAIWYKSDFTRQELFDRLKYLEPSIPLRTGYLYNNLMYAASGQILEILSGKTWEEFVTERIFRPLAMDHSIFVVEDMLNSEDFMRPYYEKRDTTILLPYPVYTQQKGLGPAGAIISNISDLSNWVIAQIHGGSFRKTQVIPAAVVKETMQPAIPAGSAPTRFYENLNPVYCLGRISSAYKGHYRVQHGGAIGGIYSVISIYPADSIGIIVFTNRVTQLPGIISNMIADQIMGLPWSAWSERSLIDYQKSRDSQRESRKKGDADRITGTKPSHPLSDYTGVYDNPAYGIMAISADNDMLRFTFNNTTLPLQHYHYDRFISPDDEIEGKWSLIFGMDAQGNISTINVSLDEKEVVFTRKADPGLSDPGYLKKFTGQYEINASTIDIVLKNNVLVLSVSPPQHLVPVKENTFRIKEYPDQIMEFRMDEKGIPAEIRLIADGRAVQIRRKK